MAFQFNFSIVEEEDTDRVLVAEGDGESVRRIPVLESLIQSEKAEPQVATGCQRGNVSVTRPQEESGDLRPPTHHPPPHEGGMWSVKVEDYCLNKGQRDLARVEKCAGLSLPATAVVGGIANKAVAREHTVLAADVAQLFDNKVVETVDVGASFSVNYINVSVLERTISSTADEDGVAVSQAISAHSDLISGTYEGGMKIWECTFDLITYLQEAEVQFADKMVLDLGCGAGLLGIVALKHHAREVHFQDYNGTVIEELTLPNVLLNCEEDYDGPECRIEKGNAAFASHVEIGQKCHPKCTVTMENKVSNDSNITTGQGGGPNPKRRKEAVGEQQECLSRCRFFSGEWSRFRTLLLNADRPLKYDIILTSETIYNVEYYPALHEVLSDLLNEKGHVYVAGKTHYFGVGGGIQLFESFVEEKSIFGVRTVKVIDEGLQRIILELAFKRTS